MIDFDRDKNYETIVTEVPSYLFLLIFQCDILFTMALSNDQAVPVVIRNSWDLVLMTVLWRKAALCGLTGHALHNLRDTVHGDPAVKSTPSRCVCSEQLCRDVCSTITLCFLTLRQQKAKM
jgi:hypothetical protein